MDIPYVMGASLDSSQGYVYALQADLSCNQITLGYVLNLNIGTFGFLSDRNGDLRKFTFFFSHLSSSPTYN